MGRVIFVTSFKGGVGKTTVTANLTAALAFLGKKVLAIDGDFGMRCLDMALGLQNGTVYNICDVLRGGAELSAATVRDRSARIDFIPAPMSDTGEIIPRTAFFTLFRALRDKYDYILIDSSAEESAYYRSFAAAADDALIVALHRSTAVRAAEKTAYALSDMGFRNLRLIVNGYDAAKAERGELPSLYNMIGLSTVKLLGAVPYDDELISDQERGVIAFAPQTRYLRHYETAFFNIACRVTGKRIPLLAGVYDKVRR